MRRVVISESDVLSGSHSDQASIINKMRKREEIQSLRGCNSLILRSGMGDASRLASSSPGVWSLTACKLPFLGNIQFVSEGMSPWCIDGI